MGKKAKLILKGISEESGQPFKREIRTLDEVRESGQYTLVGYNVSEDEGLPPAEYDDCKYCFIEALLSVTRNSSSSGFVQKETIGQTITISNREDGGTNIYNRSWSKRKNNEEWTPWLMMLRGDISVVAPTNDLNEKVSVVAESLRTEKERAENAEKGLKDAIDAETANAKLAHDSIKSDITEQSNRITQTNINLHKCGTARFERIEENVVEINKGEIGIENPRVVYYKPNNIFVAVDNSGNYWDTWNGMGAYMSGGKIREDKVYLCNQDIFVCNNGNLVRIETKFTEDIAAGASLKKYILIDYYYNPSGVLTKSTDSTKYYRALPLLKISTPLTINQTAWHSLALSARCLDANGSYIGDAIREDYKDADESKRTLKPLANTEYMAIYWQRNESVEEEDFETFRIDGIYNIVLQEVKDVAESNLHKIQNVDNNCIFVQKNDLLADTTFVVGYIESSGIITENETYKTTDYIPIKTKLVYGDFLRFLCWYDEKKQMITRINQSELLTGVVYEKPENAFFVRATLYSNRDSRLYTRDSNKDISFLIKNGEIVDTPLYTLYLEDINLFNPNDKDVLIGSYVVDDYIYEASNYNSSGYIPVKEYTKYYVATDSYNQSNKIRGCRYVTFYDNLKGVINHISDGSSPGIISFTTPENCHYIRAVFYADAYEKAQIAESATLYVDYKQKTLCSSASSEENANSIITRKNLVNTLYGKKWAVCGDSFSDGFSTDMPSDWFIDNGLYAGKSKVYGYLIANRNNMRLQWLAAGGRTMATPSDSSFTNAFSREGYYDTIDKDVDYITLYFGINDSHHAPGSTGDDGEDKTGIIPLGTIEDKTRDTFYGAWNVVIPYLIEQHPFAKIGIIISNGCDTPEYRQAEIEIAKKYGIPYIDLNGDEKTPCMIRSKNETISSEVRELRTRQQAIDYDGSVYGNVNRHPNKDAHEYQSTFIENWMKGL